MTPAEELRTAAAKVRETAAPHAAYLAKHPRVAEWYAIGDTGMALMEQAGTPTPEADDAWIALMSPALAEPLARWLDDVADGFESERRIEPGTSDEDDALAIARVINRTAP